MLPSKIVCGVDFSAYSKTALVEAVVLACQLRASLVLVHVEDRPLWMGEPYVHLPGDVRQDVLRQSEAELAQWEVEARGLREIPVSSQLLEGVPWEMLVSVARNDRDVGWIVVGSHGRTGIERVLMGSVAERVVRHAPCSVVVSRARREP